MRGFCAVRTFASILSVFAASGSLFCQPSVQDYANYCYGQLGIAGKIPDSFACSDGTKLNASGAPDPCKQPAWLGSGLLDLRPPRTTHQCYGNTYIQTIKPGGDVLGALLCRHKLSESANLTDFDDIAMILSDTSTGKTCWFQTKDGVETRNASGVATALVKLDGTKVPGPHTKNADKFWLPPGETASIQCANCHDNGPWMNSPWLFGQFKGFKNGDDTAYSFIDDGGKYGFGAWPASRFATVGSKGIAGPNPKPRECTHCHKISAKIGWRVVDPDATRAAGHTVYTTIPNSSYSRWIDWAVGKTKPTASSAADPGDFAITHWMPTSNKPAIADYDTAYGGHFLLLKSCMEQLAADFVGPPAKECKALKVTGAAPAPGASPMPTLMGALPVRPRDAGGVDLQLLVLDGPGGNPQPVMDSSGNPTANPVANMQPPDDPKVIPPNSYLRLQWASPSNCSVVATFPPGVTAVGASQSMAADPVGTGSNWLPDESPQDVGFVKEPGEYTFHLDCGFQDESDNETSTEVRVKIGGMPPTLMRLDTAVNNSFRGEALSYMSYVNPMDSYTQTLQTDAAMSPGDTARISWIADNVMPGSCQVSEVGGGAPPVALDAGEMTVALASASSRTFKLTCADLNGGMHSLQARIHQGDVCDVDGDGVITIRDIQAIFASRNQSASSGDLRDGNQSGVIDVVDARFCATKCPNLFCAVNP